MMPRRVHCSNFFDKKSDLFFSLFNIEVCHNQALATRSLLKSSVPHPWLRPGPASVPALAPSWLRPGPRMPPASMWAPARGCLRRPCGPGLRCGQGFQQRPRGQAWFLKHTSLRTDQNSFFCAELKSNKTCAVVKLWSTAQSLSDNTDRCSTCRSYPILFTNLAIKASL